MSGERHFSRVGNFVNAGRILTHGAGRIQHHASEAGPFCVNEARRLKPPDCPQTPLEVGTPVVVTVLGGMSYEAYQLRDTSVPRLSPDRASVSWFGWCCCGLGGVAGGRQARRCHVGRLRAHRVSIVKP